MRSISSRSTTALDADRGASFADHCRNFGLPPVKLPVAIPVAVDGAPRMADAVLAVRAALSPTRLSRA